MVATRAAVDRCGPSYVHPPLSHTGTEDGQGRGGGVRGHERRVKATQSPLLPSRSSSACTTKSPAGGGLPAWQSRQGRKSGSSGTPWSSLPHGTDSRRTSAAGGGTTGGRPPVLRHVSAFDAEQVINVPKIPQDCIPHRAVFEPQLAEQLVEVWTAVTFVPGSALFHDRHGHEWVRVPGADWGVLLEGRHRSHPAGPFWIDAPPAQGCM